MIRRSNTIFKRGSSLALAFTLAVAAIFSPFSGLVGTGSAATVSTPVNAKAYVGGNSIALTWQPATGETPSGYGIYRDNYQWLAWVDPSTINGPGATTQRFVDTTVTNGTTYTYYISAFDDVYDESPLTSAITVTQPTTPVAVPTITIAAGVPSDLVTYMNDSKALLQTWYPKLVTKLGKPTGSRTSFTIRTVNEPGKAAYYSSTTNTISIDETYARAHLTDYIGADIWIHESTHVAQSYVAAPSWIVEGIADYVKHYMFGSQVSTVPTAYTWQNGYERVGYFLNWIETTYNKPDFTKDLHVAAFTAWNQGIFYTQTRLSVGELWREMAGTKIHTPMTLKNSSNKCIDVPGSSTTSGVDYQLYTCNGSSAQTYLFYPDTYTSNQGAIKAQDNCMDVQSSGTADGTRVWQYTCNSSSVAQKWIIQVDGTLKNPNSGKCLQPVAGGTTDGTKLEIRTCAGTAIQKWGVRPISIMQNQSTSTLCLDSANGQVAAGTSGWMWNTTCDYSTDQQLEFVQTTPGSNEGTYAMYNRALCIATQNAGTANGTKVIVTACSGNANQQWIRQPDSTLKDVNSGKCMQPVGGATANGTLMEIQPCTTAAIQKWNFALF